jgi:hypothetical protein
MMARSRGLPAVGTAVLAALAVWAATLPAPAAAADRDAARGHMSVLHIGARDSRFDLSGRRLSPGPVKVSFTNFGAHTHMLQIARVDLGRTQADFVTVLEGFLDGTVTEAPDWLHSDVPFGFGPTSPGRSVTAAVRLTRPGLYVLSDLLYGQSGEPFALQGMVASFSVAGDMRSGVLPRADATIVGGDAAFFVPPLRAGELVLRLRNAAQVERQFAIVKLEPGMTLQQLREWVLGGQVGPAPGEFVANVLPIAVGRSLLIKVRLAAGRYVLADDGETDAGVPYSTLGLLTVFDVRRAGPVWRCCSGGGGR